MKKVLLLTLSFFCLVIYSQCFSQPVNIPDVMGISNPSNKITSPYDVITPRDTMPVFPGFPKEFSGMTFEGSIFCNLDSDTDLEIVVNSTYFIQAFNKDGSNVSGWPINMTQQLQGAPACGDIDGDGQEEIVCVTTFGPYEGKIHAYRKNGTAVPGFPITHGYSSRSPVLADLNNDGKLEIIVNRRLKNAGEVWIYDADGTVYPGWPKPINHVPASSSAIGDITGDGIPEIIAESYTSLYAWDRDGNLLTGFPYILSEGYKNSYSSPVLADINNDGARDIIFGSQRSSPLGGCVTILNHDGTVFPNWPKITSYWVYSPPAVGFINDDNILDIAVGDQVISFTPVNYIYCWDVNGNSLEGFPAGPMNAINSQILIGDIDNDNKMELVVDDNVRVADFGQYLAFNHDGTPVTGWPIAVNGTTIFSVPCLTDIDRNGILDIIGGGQTFSSGDHGYLYLWNTGKNYVANKMILPVFQYNVRHDGVYNTPTFVSVSNSPVIVQGFELKQNYPNPFNPSTTINFSIPKSGFVKLAIFDLLGKEVVSLVNETRSAGNYEINFNASSLSSGIYIYKITSGEFTASKQMILIK